MRFGIANLSITPLRKEASERSEMVSQVLFGEHFEILKKKKNWLMIRLIHDKYEGWIDEKMYQPLSKEYFEKLNQHKPFFTKEITNVVYNTVEKSSLVIPQGCSLPFFKKENNTFIIGEITFKFQGNVSLKENNNVRTSIIEQSFNYINSPYLWGGRTPFGIDCSGLSQILYRSNGINIPRDASQQVDTGKTINFINDAEPGDLAFFDNEDGKIIHVGVILKENKIIHASGKVRIDIIDHQGIFNSEKKQYSHKLRVIKSII